MERHDWTTESKLVAPNVKAAMRTYYWPDQGETDRLIDSYVICQTWSSRPILARPMQSRQRPVRMGAISVSTPYVGIHFRSHEAMTRAFVLRFDRHYFEAVTGLSDWCDAEFAHYLDVRSSFLKSAMDRLQHETLSPGFASLALTETLSHAILLDLTSLIEGQRRRASERSKGGLALWQLRRITDRLSDGEAASPTIQELATLCSVSADHLMRAFKRTTGETLYHRIEMARVDRTKALLAEGQLPLKAVAHQAGFSSPAHLSSAFSRLTGMTPSQFRAMSRYPG